jgi:hypothetical protein
MSVNPPYLPHFTILTVDLAAIATIVICYSKLGDRINPKVAISFVIMILTINRGNEMKAFEVMATVNDQKQLLLDENLDLDLHSRVKVILLVAEENEHDPDDTPVEEIKASLRRALQEAKAGKTRPISELWERIDD